MAGVERFELPTVGFGDRCSTNWNYTPATEENYTQAISKVKGKMRIVVNSLIVRPNKQQRPQKTTSLYTWAPVETEAAVILRLRYSKSTTYFLVCGRVNS